MVGRGARVHLDASHKLVAGHALDTGRLMSLSLGSLGLCRLRSLGRTPGLLGSVSGSLLDGSLSRCSCYLGRHLQKPRNYGARTLHLCGRMDKKGDPSTDDALLLIASPTLRRRRSNAAAALAIGRRHR
jgi:hypothetical protein